MISIRACKTCAPHNCSWTSWMIFCKFAVVHWPGYTILKTFLSPKTVVVLATTGLKASLANKNSRNQKSWLNNLSPHQLNTVGHLVCTETYCCRLQPGREGSRGRCRAFLFVFVRFLEGSLPTQQRFVVSTGLTPPKTNISSHPKNDGWKMKFPLNMSVNICYQTLSKLASNLEGPSFCWLPKAPVFAGSLRYGGPWGWWQR